MSESHVAAWRSVPMLERQGVVLDVDGRWCTVLTPDGEFFKIRLEGQAEIGQEVRFSRSQIRGSWGRTLTQVMSYAAVLLLAVSLTFGQQNRERPGQIGPGARRQNPVVVPSLTRTKTMAPAAYVTIDINPSIEFAVDSAETVISCRGMNADGERVLSQVDVVGEKLEDAVVHISQVAYKLGYLKQGQENQILLTGASVSDLAEGQLEKDLQSVKSAAIEGISESDPDVKLQVAAVAVSQDVRAKAEQVNLSMGKYIVLGTARTAGARLSPDQMRRESLRKVLKSVGLGVQDIVREYNVAAAVQAPTQGGAAQAVRPSEGRKDQAPQPVRPPVKVAKTGVGQADRSRRLEAAKSAGITVLPTLKYSDLGKASLQGDSVEPERRGTLAPDVGSPDGRRIVIEFDLLSLPKDGEQKVSAPEGESRTPQGASQVTESSVR